MKIRNGKIYFSSIKFTTLDFIKKFIEKNDYSPTLLEISKGLGFSRSRAGTIVAELYKLGMIYKGDSNHRKIRMSDSQMSAVPKLKSNRGWGLIVK